MTARRNRGSGGEFRRALGARRGEAARDAAAFFCLSPSAPFCGVFPCSLRNHPGHLYVFEFHVGFASLNLTEHAKWHAPAKTVNNLEIVGASSLVVGLTTGLNLEFEGVDDRDAVYECMVSMLEKIPPSPGEEVHGSADARVAAPLRLGFEQERYVFVHVVQADALPDAATGSVSIATAALGRYGAAVTAKGPSLVNAPSRFGRTLAFPAAEADLAADAVMVAVAGGGVGDAGFGAETLGEAQIPLAMLPRDRAGADEVKENPYTVSLMPPGELQRQGSERDPGSRASESPRLGGRSFRRDGDSASAKARARARRARLRRGVDRHHLGPVRARERRHARGAARGAAPRRASWTARRAPAPWRPRRRCACRRRFRASPSTCTRCAASRRRGAPRGSGAWTRTRWPATTPGTCRRTSRRSSSSSAA